MRAAKTPQQMNMTNIVDMMIITMVTDEVPDFFGGMGGFD